MRIAGLVLKGLAIFLVLLAIFGGVFDLAEMLSVSVPRSIALGIALLLLVADRQLKVMGLSLQVDSKRGLQVRIDRLAEFRNEVINSLYAGTPTRKEFKKWEERFHSWEDELVDYLQANFPYAVFEMFKDQGMIPSVDFEHLAKDKRIRRKHRSYLRRIAKHLDILEMLIQQNTSLTRVREPSLREVLARAGETS